MERSNNLSTRILTVFYRHPNDFISSMLVGNNIALVIYGILMAELIEHYILVNVLTNQAALVAIETIISTLIILVTGEFMPKTLFRINPNLTLRACSYRPSSVMWYSTPSAVFLRFCPWAFCV